MKTLTRTLLAFALCAVFLCSVAYGQSSTFSRKQPTATAAQLVSGNSQRSSLLIENVGSVGVAISNISTVTYVTGYVIAPNQKVVIKGAKDQLYGITAASTGDLRIWECSNGACDLNIERINQTGAANNASATIMGASDGTDTVNGNVLFYNLSTAITANSTTTSTAAGTLAITSNATGLGTIFRSDATKWQLLANYSDDAVSANLGTIATTSTTVDYVIADFAGTLTGVDFSGTDTLATSDTNYVIFTITNLGQAGSGTNPMLLATAASGTQVTGGSAITANTKRSFTLNGTGSNLIVAKGDRIKVLATVTGTLANTVTFSKFKLYFTRLS